MTWFLFSPLGMTGFILGALFGTLATDLTREEVRCGSFKPTRRFWQSRQQTLVVVFMLWLTLLMMTGFLSKVGASEWWREVLAGNTGDWWQQLLVGSVIGAAAAPWVWLHFVRHFGAGGRERLAADDTLISARAHQIWLRQGQPDGHGDEHYFEAKKEIEDAGQVLIETSTKSAEQQLARYQLVSILFGVALLVATLLPILKEWLPRAQQFQAFGVSLTLIERQTSSQNRGTPLAGNSPDGESGGDRLLNATTEAYKIGAADPQSPLASLGRIGATLNDFRYLSVIDRDRAFIAWLTFEQPGAADQLRRIESSAPLTLMKYIEKADDVFRKNHKPERWVDPALDWSFVADSTYISKCLHNKAHETYDPHMFTVEVSHFLQRFVNDVYIGEIRDRDFRELPVTSDDGTICDYNLFRTAELEGLYASGNHRYKI